jgi:hypothetical protein
MARNESKANVARSVSFVFLAQEMELVGPIGGGRMVLRGVAAGARAARKDGQEAEKLCDADGFGHERVHAGFEATALIRFGSVAGHADDDGALGVWKSSFPNRASGFEAIFQRHLLVHEDDFELVSLDCGKGFAPIAHRRDGVAAIAKKFGEKLAALESVFGDEDSHGSFDAGNAERRLQKG